MLQQPRAIRIIYMVSSALFSAASCVYGWTAPLGAALGLAANLTEDIKNDDEDIRNDNIKNFSNAVEAALDRTKQRITSKSQQKMLDELCQTEMEPGTLKELINIVESHREHYWTKDGFQDVINIFEMYFRDEISKSHYLSNLYILSTGFVTLDKLKIIVDDLDESNKKLDKIQNEVSGIGEMLKSAKKVCNECIYSIAFILVSMAGFLGCSILGNYLYDKILIIIAPICYGISDFLIYFLNKGGYVFALFNREKLKNRNLNGKIYKTIISILIPVILPVSCFWIILLASDMNSNDLFFPTYGLILGSIMSIILKNFRF